METAVSLVATSLALAGDGDRTQRTPLPYDLNGHAGAYAYVHSTFLHFFSFNLFEHYELKWSALSSILFHVVSHSLSNFQNLSSFAKLEYILYVANRSAKILL